MMNRVPCRLGWFCSRRPFGIAILAVSCFFPGFLLAAEPAAETVRVVISFDNGVEKKLDDLPWSSEMTVLDAMEAARQRPSGINFKYRGSGATALLTEIDGFKNQGGGSNRKNWSYRVNGKLADRSFGIYKLKPADTVLWKFGTFKPDP